MHQINKSDSVFIKSSLHTIAPYVGKLRPEIVSTLIDTYVLEKQTILDPFCGSGTVPLEAWIKGYKTIGIDLNYYAVVLTKAKLNPYLSLDKAMIALEDNATIVESLKTNYEVENVPEWVSKFFHPNTLNEIMVWMDVLVKKEDHFLISCLLGILHHQRPGFLSYPSSHGAPYLRDGKYPIDMYPEMYEYRNVFERLKKKVIRSYKEMPELDFSIERDVYHINTADFNEFIEEDVAIITSPPYMKSLTYARDNRLRLWFLGYSEWEQLDKSISINKHDFSDLMAQCFKSWAKIQRKGNYCILVVGDIIFDRSKKQSIPNLICDLAAKSDYDFVEIIDYPININRKVVKTESQIKTEKICIFQRR